MLKRGKERLGSRACFMGEGKAVVAMKILAFKSCLVGGLLTTQPYSPPKTSPVIGSALSKLQDPNFVLVCT